MDSQTFIYLLGIVIQVAVIAFCYYKIYYVLRGSPALPQLGVITAIVLGCYALAIGVGFPVMVWITEKIFYFLPVICVVLFQVEFKRLLGAVAQFFRLNVQATAKIQASQEELKKNISAICQTVDFLAARRTGALIVLEQSTNLDALCEKGKKLNAPLVPELLETIFYKGTPLHDCAVIIRNGIILAAKCTLPLSENEEIRSKYGMRHQAACGQSEQSDALVILVAEETGAIQLFFDGEMTPCDEADDLQKKLLYHLRQQWQPEVAEGFFAHLFHALFPRAKQPKEQAEK